MPQNTFFQNHKKEILLAMFSFVFFLILIFVLFFNNGGVGSGGGGVEGGGGSYLSKFSNLFNFTNKKPAANIGKNGGGGTGGDTASNTQDYYVEGLIKVWDKPVAGYGLYYKPATVYYGDGSSTSTRGANLIFVDSESGLIFEKDLLRPTSTPRQVTATSSTYDLKNIYHAYFLNNDAGLVKKVLLQYLDDKSKIKSLLASVSTEHEGKVKLQNTQNLPDNISNVSISDNNTKLVYVVSKEISSPKSKDIYSDWYTLSTEDSSPAQVYTSPLNIWNTIVTDDGQVYAYEKDTAFLSSNFYKLEVVGDDNYLNNKLKKFYGDHTGLSFTLKESTLLVSANTESGLKTYVNRLFFSEPFKDKNLKELPFNTLSKKCAFAKTGGDTNDFALCAVPKELDNYDAGLPDAWYQGVANFKDNIYYLDLKNPDNSSIFYSLTEKAGTNFDLVSPEITDTGTHLVMKNKNDHSLWTLNIANILYGDGGQ